MIGFVKLANCKLQTDGVARSDADGEEMRKMRTFNDSIGIMLRSYTNAINKMHNRSGKLFREGTKAECITCSDGITPSFYNTSSGTQINITDPEKQYPELCFHYIHQNPVKAGWMQKATDWEFSSARDYVGFRNGKLVNKEVARKYIININFA
jgi:putative transposase